MGRVVSQVGGVVSHVGGVVSQVGGVVSQVGGVVSQVGVVGSLVVGYYCEQCEVSSKGSRWLKVNRICVPSVMGNVSMQITTNSRCTGVTRALVGCSTCLESPVH